MAAAGENTASSSSAPQWDEQFHSTGVGIQLPISEDGELWVVNQAYVVWKAANAQLFWGAKGKKANDKCKVLAKFAFDYLENRIKTANLPADSIIAKAAFWKNAGNYQYVNVTIYEIIGKLQDEKASVGKLQDEKAIVGTFCEKFKEFQQWAISNKVVIKEKCNKIDLGIDGKSSISVVDTDEDYDIADYAPHADVLKVGLGEISARIDELRKIMSAPEPAIDRTNMAPEKQAELDELVKQMKAGKESAMIEYMELMSQEKTNSETIKKLVVNGITDKAQQQKILAIMASQQAPRQKKKDIEAELRTLGIHGASELSGVAKRELMKKYGFDPSKPLQAQLNSILDGTALGYTEREAEKILLQVFLKQEPDGMAKLVNEWGIGTDPDFAAEAKEDIESEIKEAEPIYENVERIKRRQLNNYVAEATRNDDSLVDIMNNQEQREYGYVSMINRRPVDYYGQSWPDLRVIDVDKHTGIPLRLQQDLVGNRNHAPIPGMKEGRRFI